MKQFIITSLLAIAIAASSYSQESNNPEILNLFLDCQNGCDQTYFRQEMGFVNFMQDRQRAEVFLQLIRQQTGAGGREFTLLVQGLRRFDGQQDTLLFYTGPNDTQNQIRVEVMRNIKKAILPYLLETSLKDKIEFTVKNDSKEVALNTAVKDPWNYWTFRTRVNTFYEGQSQSNQLNLNSDISANRTTEANKFSFFARYNYSRSEFKLEDEDDVVAVNETAFGRIQYVVSIDDHWSIGGNLGNFSSTFRNVDYGIGIDPTIEYNVFPYSESAQHQFTFKYNVGPSYRNYQELTVFDKLEEWYWEQQFAINYEQIKDWGTVVIELEYENYLSDFSQLQVGLNPEIEWNITKGLNIDFFSSIRYIANLRNIQKSEVDNNSILLQNRQLDTSFSFFASLGLSYRFGSAYNNIVNTRF